jgi:hypothetical protein
MNIFQKEYDYDIKYEAFEKNIYLEEIEFEDTKRIFKCKNKNKNKKK